MTKPIIKNVKGQGDFFTIYTGNNIGDNYAVVNTGDMLVIII